MAEPGPEPIDGFVAPDYGEMVPGRTLGDVLPAVATALGVDVGFHQTALRLPEAPAYVVFLVDGLGHELVRRHRADAPFLTSLLDGNDQAPVTCGVPSTTATSLTSLGTALTPGAHGLVGFTSRVPGTDRLLNALAWDKQVDPLEWQPHPTAFARLAGAGVHVSVLSKREFRDSGLTRASQRGAEYVGVDRVGERLAGVVSAATERPSLSYVYDGDLDWTGHRYGVDSPQWRAQLSAVDDALEQLREALDPAARLVVVADHGMVDSPPEARTDVDEHLELRAGVRLLGGEARFRHLYCAAGAVDDVVATWRGFLGDRAVVLTRDEAIDRGWFGHVEAQVRPRLGDVTVAMRGRHGVVSTTDFPYEARLVGLHGSLTPDEMYIPILVS
ncbi:alkaline phosphatase family protein [Nocardioides terrisoli]|uniref:alkaline phosphatase family protein n=1 Tax=Nocardioides terrisoli TaxID=3388267 RepID=UPI00287BAC3F|nr:alkaline phosphatase family protein [Nocardioides marmorisolisilvae]